MADPWEEPALDEASAPPKATIAPAIVQAPEAPWETTGAGVAAPPEERGGSRDPLMVTVILQSTGDARRDGLRLRRIHGLLTSYPGTDRFALHVYEASRRYHLEFPNSTIGYCRELHAQLITLLGQDRVLVERLPIQ